jgi:hypothetical protein
LRGSHPFFEMKSCYHPSVVFRAEFRHFRKHSILFEGSRRSVPVGYADVRISGSTTPRSIPWMPMALLAVHRAHALAS